MKYELAIFDLDGTLIDTSEGILAAVAYTFDIYGIPPLEGNAKRRFIGPPIQESFQQLPGVDKRTALEMAKVFRDRYKDVDLLKAKPYDGIFPLLQKCKNFGIKTAVATYKREDYALKLLNHFGFDRYMTCMFGTDMAGTMTKAGIIRRCMESCNEKPSSSMMIGDSPNDMNGAIAAGIGFLGVSYGFGYTPGQKMDESPFVIGMSDSPDEIWKFVKNEEDS